MREKADRRLIDRFPVGRRALVAMLAVVSGAVSMVALAPATASDSGDCTDGTYTEVPLVTGELGLPLWVAIETSSAQGAGLGVCYGTGGPDSPKTIGGYTYAYVGGNTLAGASNESDSTSAVQAPVAGDVDFQASVEPGGPSGGQRVNVRIPFHLCTGPSVCYPGMIHDNELRPTGVIIGTIEQADAGGISAAYRVSELCVRVDGVDVLGCDGKFDDVGATTTGTSPVTSEPAPAGPCVTTVCAPSYTYVGTTGETLATIYVPGLPTPIEISGVHTCLYRKDTYTECPA